MSGSELTPCVLFGTQGHGNEARVAAAFIAALQRCGRKMTPLYNILDSTTGKQVRAFKCECGDRSVP